MQGFEIFKHYGLEIVKASIEAAKNRGDKDPYWKDLEDRAKQYFGDKYYV